MAATTKEPESWEEFRHPRFRRGRRDLLGGITRQKDGGRLKRKRGETMRSVENAKYMLVGEMYEQLFLRF